MRLVVQIPCLNEEDTLPAVLSTIPRKIDGIDEIIILVIDDGSTDRTVQVAREHGVTHFVTHARNRGLGRSFHDGVQRALELGADILVNTDGDNQYPQARIGDLVQPILAGTADIVIADRQVHLVEHFSGPKVLLQKVGSQIVNRAAGTTLPDAASGFRAYSRDSLMLLNTITRFSYCMETIIQAGNKKLAITSVKILTNPKTRESRLFSSTYQHVLMSAGAIIRAYIMYKPYVIFSALAVLFGVLGALPFARYAVLQLTDSSGNHLQSLLVGAVLLVMSFMSIIIGIVGDLLRTNRALIEDTLEHTKKMRFGMLAPERGSWSLAGPAAGGPGGDAGLAEPAAGRTGDDAGPGAATAGWPGGDAGLGAAAAGRTDEDAGLAAAGVISADDAGPADRKQKIS